ncbi:MAG: hypothetical protein RR188_04055 [Eubacterium sp.]
MNRLLIPIILTLITGIPLFSCLFYVVNVLFQKRFAQKYIVLFLCVTALIHTLMSNYYSLDFFKGYFMFGIIILFPIVFYKGESLVRRMGCGFLLCVFFMFMDLLNLSLFLLLSDSNMVLGFSLKRQIYYIGINFILYPFLVKPVKMIIQHLIHKSLLFFYQIFLLMFLFLFQIGTMNYMFAVDTKDNMPYVIDNAESVEFASCILGLFIFDNLIIYALKRLDKSYKIESEIKLNQQKTKLQQHYYTLVEAHYRQSRELMHDLKNHVLTLEHLYETGENEAASRYVDDALNKMEGVLLEKERENSNLSSE